MSHDEFDFEGRDKKLEADLSSADVGVRANALFELGSDMVGEDHHDVVGMAYLEEAFAIYQSLDKFDDVAKTAWWFGLGLSVANEDARALEVHLIGVDCALKAMNGELEVQNLTCIAQLYKKQKDYSNAARYFDMALQVAQIQNPMMAKGLANNLIRAWRKVGQLDRAAELVRTQVEEGRASGDDFPIVMGDQELCAILIEQGKYAEALEAATEAYNIAQYVDQVREVERAQYNMARSMNLLGQYSLALETLRELKKAKRYRSKVKHRLRVDYEIAKAELGLGNHSAAASMFSRIIPLFDSFNVPATAVEASFGAAQNYMAMGNDLDAELLLVKCLERSADAKLPSLVLDASLLLGGIYVMRSQWDSALSIYEPLVSDPTNQFSVWFPYVMQQLAVVYLRLDRPSDALSAAMAVIASKLDPSLNKGEAWFVRSELALAAGDRAAAGRYGRKALKAFLAAGESARAASLAEKYL